MHCLGVSAHHQLVETAHVDLKRRHGLRADDCVYVFRQTTHRFDVACVERRGHTFMESRPEILLHTNAKQLQCDTLRLQAEFQRLEIESHSSFTLKFMLNLLRFHFDLKATRLYTWNRGALNATPTRRPTEISRVRSNRNQITLVCRELKRLVRRLFAKWSGIWLFCGSSGVYT